MILLTAEPKWFSITVKLRIGPGNVYNYYGEVTTNILRLIVPRKNDSLPNLIFTFLFLKLKLRVGVVDIPALLKEPYRPLEPQPFVTYIATAFLK